MRGGADFPRRGASPPYDDERLAQEQQLAAVVERAVEAERSGTDVGVLQQEAEWLIAASDFVDRGGQDYRAPEDRAGIEDLALAVRARLGPSALLVEIRVGGRHPGGAGSRW